MVDTLFPVHVRCPIMDWLPVPAASPVVTAGSSRQHKTDWLANVDSLIFSLSQNNNNNNN